MARKPRIYCPGALYHVTLRGNAGQAIFFDNRDRTRFYLLLQEQIERFRRLEDVSFPEGFDFSSVIGLTTEVMEKLKKIKPHSLGQASRISGVTPAAISILMVNLKKQGYL